MARRPARDPPGAGPPAPQCAVANATRSPKPPSPACCFPVPAWPRRRAHRPRGRESKPTRSLAGLAAAARRPPIALADRSTASSARSQAAGRGAAALRARCRKHRCRCRCRATSARRPPPAERPSRPAHPRPAPRRSRHPATSRRRASAAPRERRPRPRRPGRLRGEWRAWADAPATQSDRRCRARPQAGAWLAVRLAEPATRAVHRPSRSGASARRSPAAPPTARRRGSSSAVRTCRLRHRPRWRGAQARRRRSRLGPWRRCRGGTGSCGIRGRAAPNRANRPRLPARERRLRPARPKRTKGRPQPTLAARGFAWPSPRNRWLGTIRPQTAHRRNGWAEDRGGRWRSGRDSNPRPPA